MQLYEVGDKRELLVTVQLEDPSNPDSTVTVDMTTTLPEGGEPAGFVEPRRTMSDALWGVLRAMSERELLRCDAEWAAAALQGLTSRAGQQLAYAAQVSCHCTSALFCSLTRATLPPHLPFPQPCCTGACARRGAAPTGCSRPSSC